MKRTALIAIAAVLFAALPAPLAAQNPPAATDTASLRVAVTAGRSTVIATDFDIIRIAVTNPEIADAVVVSPREILVDGRRPGTISLIVWGADRRSQYDLAVDPAITTLQQQLRNLFPGENVTVTIDGEATTLSGSVSSNDVMLRMGEIAAKTASKSNIINLLQVPGGPSSQQVMLQV